MQGFRHVHPLAQSIIRHGSNWKLWVLCDRDPAKRWIDGRVVLLGDAAHPMMQYFAQGACMALEDAVCVSHMLDSWPDNIAAALEQYRKQRFGRAAGSSPRMTQVVSVTAPALQRSAPQELRAALRPGNDVHGFISAWRSILPVPVFGSSSQNRISRGYL